MKATLNWIGLLVATAGFAESRDSASYRIPSETLSAGGAAFGSTSYTGLGTLEDVVGVSTVATPAETVKHGFIGQLYEVTALQLAAAPTLLPEDGTSQLSGVELLDDETVIVVPAESIAWSIVSGPLASVSLGGLASASPVYEDAPATVRGSYAGNSNLVGLTVLNTLRDNYGAYAGDGINDDWQVFYFGLNNPNAGPLLDPDFDGLRNLFEWATHLNPIISSVAQVTAVWNEPFLDFTYTRSMAAREAGALFTVEWTDTLPAGSWSSDGVTEEVISTNGLVQEIKARVPVGVDGRRFVQLGISLPP